MGISKRNLILLLLAIDGICSSSIVQLQLNQVGLSIVTIGSISALVYVISALSYLLTPILAKRFSYRSLATFMTFMSSVLYLLASFGCLNVYIISICYILTSFTGYVSWTSMETIYVADGKGTKTFITLTMWVAIGNIMGLVIQYLSSIRSHNVTIPYIIVNSCGFLVYMIASFLIRTLRFNDKVEDQSGFHFKILKNKISLSYLLFNIIENIFTMSMFGLASCILVSVVHYPIWIVPLVLLAHKVLRVIVLKFLNQSKHIKLYRKLFILIAIILCILSCFSPKLLLVVLLIIRIIGDLTWIPLESGVYEHLKNDGYLGSIVSVVGITGYMAEALAVYLGSILLTYDIKYLIYFELIILPIVFIFATYIWKQLCSENESLKKENYF